MEKKAKKNKDEDKDKSYRERLAICDKVVGELISMLLDGDNTYLTKGRVHERMMAATKAKNRLHDPQFILQLLRNLMEPIIAENGSVDDVQGAFQALESYLTQYANPVQKKRSAKHLPDSISLTASQKEMVVQPEATVDQTQQLITEDKLFSIVKNMVNKVLGPYLGRLQNQKLTNPVSILGDPESSRGAEIRNNIEGHHDADPVALYMNLKDYGGGFELCNPSDDKIYDDSGKGTSGARANPHNMELSQENTFTDDPVLPSLPCSDDMENFGDFGLCDLSDNEIYGDSGEGTSDARANQLNMKLSQENTFTVQGCADIQNSLPAVAEVHHNPVMHGLTKKLANAKGKRSVEEIKDEAYIKKGKMKLVNDN
ncbi:hypothetical protein E1A91_A03G014100v1 [Gossypium mustelinum]|uniref:Uncharacterized protein n=2 Tax=Gossypium TaxID=3633 RepID=A0A5D2ZRB7_GOSMU|nr:hypothetical protein ES332_A03G013200v1 [Gossypium tomentosum]TYJ41338.1 hypothetical protein E1A91_A03G014100v1 [Gossypium mustelinum]